MPTTPNLIAYRKDKLPRRGELEHRTLGIEELELRQSEHRIAGEDGEEIRLLEFDGYASLFNRSYRVGPYTEEIATGAFKRSLGNPDLDVVLRTEHNSLPIARTTGRVKLADGSEVPTLQLSEDESGLHTHALLDPTDPDVQRLVPKYRRGDLKEMSFAFRVGKGGDEWSDDLSHRTVNAADINRGDVSIVTYGASPMTASTLRSEELACELRSIGPDGMIGSLQDFAFAWVATHMSRHGQRETLEELEARVGKVLSSDSMSTLQHVLQLTSNADDAVGEAQVLLSDLMGTNPADDQGDGDANENGDDVTASEQLDHLGRSDGYGCAVCAKPVGVDDQVAMKNIRAADGNLEARLCHGDCEPPAEERDDPTMADYGINCDLKNVKLALAAAKASQLQDPDLETDSDDAAVVAALDEADAAIDRALVAQGRDLQFEDSDGSSMAYLGEDNADAETADEAPATEPEPTIVPDHRMNLDEAELELRALGRRR